MIAQRMPFTRMMVSDLQSWAFAARRCFLTVLIAGSFFVVIVAEYPVKLLVMVVVVILAFGCSQAVLPSIPESVQIPHSCASRIVQIPHFSFRFRKSLR